jgi:hypothetical protein
MSLIAQKVELEDMLKKERMFTVSNALKIDSSKRKMFQKCFKNCHKCFKKCKKKQ